MSIQSIIDNASSITIDKQKVAAQTVSRSGHVLTAERTTANPYRFIVNVPSHLSYSENRGLLEELDRLDVTVEEEIDIGKTNTGLSYITAYQGDLSSSQINQIYTNASTAFLGANIYLNTTGVSGGFGTLFKAGDFIQIGPTNGRYPYQVTSDVSFSSSSSLAIPVHRPVISQSGFTQENRQIAVGSNVQWFVKCQKKTAYSIIPYDRIQFRGAFELVEIIE